MNYPNKIKLILKTVCIIGIVVNTSAYIKPVPTQIDLLNQLVQLNKDRIAGYEAACKETDELYMKRLFTHFAKTSSIFKKDLEREVFQLLGKPDEGKITPPQLYQVWMQAKSMFSSHDIEKILESCHDGEKITELGYEQILSQNQQNLEQSQLFMIIEQAKLLKADQDRITSLQNFMCVNQ